LGSRIWMNKELWYLWCYCLLKASHKETWVSIKTGKGETEVKLNPGQFIFGRHKASKLLKMKPSSVRNRMEKLKNLKKVDIQADSHYSVITILNWEIYQGKGQAKGQAQDNQRTGTGQAEDTYNNDKKGKNDKKEQIGDKDFNNFWELYPKRKGMKVGKKQCQEFWKKIKEEDISLILIGTKNYAESPQAQEGYAKDPIRFLRHELWQDLQESVAEKKELPQWMK